MKHFIRKVLFVFLLVIPGSVIAFMVMGAVVMALPNKYEKYLPKIAIKARVDARKGISRVGTLFVNEPPDFTV